MSSLSDVNRLILPEDTDVLDASGIYGGFANSADSIMIPRYASTSARDTAMATSGATAGQLCGVLDLSGQVQLQLFNGVGWEAVEDIRFIYKGGNTERTNTIVSADDPDLTVSLLPNASYVIDSHLYFYNIASSTPDARTSWGTTGSPTLISRSSLGATTGTTSSTTMKMRRQMGNALATDLIWEGQISSAIGSFFLSYVREVIRLDTVAAATLTLKWAQGTSNANATGLTSYSGLEVRRLA